MKFALLILLFSCLLQLSWFETFYCIRCYINNDLMTSWLKMTSFLLYICCSKIIHLYFCLITNAFYFPWIQAQKNTSNSSNRPRNYCTIHSLKEAACDKSIIDLRKPCRALRSHWIHLHSMDEIVTQNCIFIQTVFKAFREKSQTCYPQASLEHVVRCLCVLVVKLQQMVIRQ